MPPRGPNIVATALAAVISSISGSTQGGESGSEASGRAWGSTSPNFDCFGNGHTDGCERTQHAYQTIAGYRKPLACRSHYTTTPNRERSFQMLKITNTVTGI
eukprot:scaffold243012_cov42-Prasinocladus_malaysianus.AAC.1